jgi:hypothetical protein
MLDPTPTQLSFAAAVYRGDETSVRNHLMKANVEFLKTGYSDLLTVIGQSAAIAVKKMRKSTDLSGKKWETIFNILVNENSEYQILRAYHSAKPMKLSEMAA